MRKIILNLAVSLDGFIEGPQGETDWCIMDDGSGSESGVDAHFDEFFEKIDTIFYGRVSYDLWGEYQPDANASLTEKKLWNGVHSKKKFVFTNTPGMTSDNATYIDANLYQQVEEIRKQTGKDIWLYGGANLITSFMNLGLIDNFLLALHPVVLGGGKPLFQDVNDRKKLSLNRAVPSTSGVVLLDYDAVKS